MGVGNIWEVGQWVMSWSSVNLVGYECQASQLGQRVVHRVLPGLRECKLKATFHAVNIGRPVG